MELKKSKKLIKCILFYFKIKKNRRIFRRRCERIENENSLFFPLVYAYKTRIFSHSKTRCFKAPGKHVHGDIYTRLTQNPLLEINRRPQGISNRFQEKNIVLQQNMGSHWLFELLFDISDSQTALDRSVRTL